MTRHIAQKIATAFVTIYVIITISFFLVHIMPGDPVIHLVGQEEYYYLLDNDPETLNKLIARYGLDDSLPVQYGKYLKNIVTLDFGPSYTNQNRWFPMFSEPQNGPFFCRFRPGSSEVFSGLFLESLPDGNRESFLTRS